ncbi:MAG: hypothetical protein Q4C96_11585 [Planctomycetia bacterium]|nr:hypothetical protein [Planctomycetia bacterium]
MLKRILKEESGFITFEWIMLMTVLVTGIGGTVATTHQALTSELTDVADAIISLDQSYYISSPWEINTPGDYFYGNSWDGAAGSFFLDHRPNLRRTKNTSSNNTEFTNNDFPQTL